MEEKELPLRTFLQTVQNLYQMEIVVKDFVDFLGSHPELKKELAPFLVHKNRYCMEMKHERDMLEVCYASTLRLADVCAKRKTPFYGVCPFGFIEYTLPVLCDGIAVGAICCGPFLGEDKQADWRLKRNAARYDLPFDELRAERDGHALKDMPPPEELQGLLGLAADFISRTIFDGRTKQQTLRNRQAAELISRKSYIILNIAEYIRQYYPQNISLQTLCEHCRCSKSYISHEFKKEMGYSVKAYLNKVRLTASKELLADTTLSITEIARAVGYDNPDYFGILFKEAYRMSPVAFRKSFAENLG